MNAINLGFENELFDLIFCSMTIVNFELMKNQIFHETRRVLKNNKNFIFSVYNENALEERKKVYNRILPNHTKYSCNTFIFDNGIVSEQYTQNQIKKLCNETGFKIDEIHKGEIFYLVNAKKS